MTRAEYLAATGDRGAAHRAYYGQFVTQYIRETVQKRFGVRALREALEADPHLNGIPLGSWDMLTGCTKTQQGALKAAGDSWSLAGGVCILKEAALQVVEGAGNA